MAIVLGYVPTAEGNAALDFAVAEAKRRGTELVIVNTAARGDFAAPNYADERDLDAVRARVAEAGVTSRVHSGDAEAPADEVLGVAEREDAELLVIGLRRRSAVAKLVMGSTAQRILLEASCPVAAVKAPVEQPAG